MDKVKKVLLELEKSRLTYWNVTIEVGQFLNLLIKDRKYKKVLEIGTSTGYSGIFMTEALSQTNGHLWTIESHKKLRTQLAKENFKKSGLSKFATLIEGHAPEDLPKNPKKFDLVFIDATKCEYHLYFEAIKNRVNKGGIIIADNTESHKNELEKYFTAIRKNKDFTSYPLKIGSGLLLSFKK